MKTRISIYFLLWFMNVMAVGHLQTIAVTLPTFILCLINISRIRSQYLTPADMFWFVYYIFFVIGPIQMLEENYFKEGSTVFGVYFTSDEIYRAAAITVLFALAATIAGFIWANKSPELEASRTISYTIDRSKLPLLVAVLVVSFLAVIVFSGGLGNVLAARSEKDAESLSIVRPAAIASQLIVTFLILSIHMDAVEQRRAQGPLLWGATTLALFLLAICQNPYNTPRYFLLQAWLPVILIFLRGRLRAAPFYVACLFGLLVLLPVFSLTSRFGSDLSEALQNINISEDFFRFPYIDVFDMLVYEIKYVAANGLSYGARTLGALLFFVPRAIWTGKPQLIALEMGEELVALKAAGTENLSLFFAGEFYADFALFGVFMFGLLSSWIYLHFLHNKSLLINGLRIRDFVIIAAIPIIVRGPVGANAPLVFLLITIFAVYVPIFGSRQRRRPRTAFDPVE